MSFALRYPGNVHWRDALASDLPVISRKTCWTCGNAVVSWSSFDAHEAQRALRRASLRPPRTLAQLRADPRVAEVWQEDDGFREDGGASWWVTLAPGWRWDDTGSLHEATVRDLLSALTDTYYDPSTLTL